MMMRYFSALALAATMLLAGCTTDCPIKIVTQTVQVPVAVSCVPADLAPEPVYPDTSEALTAQGVDGPRVFHIMAVARLIRIEPGKELEAIVANCKAVGTK